MFRSRALPVAWTAWLLAACGQELPDTDAAVYLGDAGKSHYSPLTQIDRDNVGSLKPAWVYDTNELADGVSTMYTSPLVVDGVLYGLTPRLNAFALDATTGKVLWRFETNAAGGIQRGLTWWEDSAGARLFYSAGPSLVALDPASGRPVSGFGIGGRLDLRMFTGGVEVSAPSPAVPFEQLLVLGLEFAERPEGGSVVAVDAGTGSLVWQFPSGTSAGIGMALDPERALLFVPTGPPIPEHLGQDRACRPPPVGHVAGPRRPDRGTALAPSSRPRRSPGPGAHCTARPRPDTVGRHDGRCRGLAEPGGVPVPLRPRHRPVPVRDPGRRRATRHDSRGASHTGTHRFGRQPDASGVCRHESG